MINPNPLPKANLLATCLRAIAREPETLQENSAAMNMAAGMLDSMAEEIARLRLELGLACVFGAAMMETKAPTWCSGLTQVLDSKKS